MSSKNYDMASDGVITVETSSGDIEVVGQEAQVLVVADDDRVGVHENGNGWVVHSHRGGSQDIKLSVPRRCGLVLRTASGDIKVLGVHGRLDVKSMSGQVNVQGARGKLRLHAVSGDIRLRDAMAAELIVDTVSGDCSVETPLQPEGRYAFHSVSGDVTFYVPVDQACTVSMATLSGNLRCDLPHEMSREGRRQYTAIINGGGVEVDVRTTSGDARLVAADMAGAEPVAESQPDEEPFSFAVDEPVSHPSGPSGKTKPLSDQPFDLNMEPETEEALSVAQQRMRILKSIEEGELTVSEGLEKLNALG